MSESRAGQFFVLGAMALVCCGVFALASKLFLGSGVGVGS